MVGDYVELAADFALEPVRVLVGLPVPRLLAAALRPERLPVLGRCQQRGDLLLREFALLTVKLLFSYAVYERKLVLP